MSKQLPFDVYIVRKVQKWEERAKAWGVELVDAIGTSPFAEMICKSGLSILYSSCLTFVDLWNGIKKMALEQLQKTMYILQCERTAYPEKHKADLDETAICSLIRASLLRSMGKFDEARRMLKTEILNHDRWVTLPIRCLLPLPCDHCPAKQTLMKLDMHSKVT